MRVNEGDRLTIQSGPRLRKGQVIDLHAYALFYDPGPNNLVSSEDSARGRVTSPNYAARGSFTHKYWIEILPRGCRENKAC